MPISFKIQGPGPAAFLKRAMDDMDQDIDDIMKLAAMEGLDIMETRMLEKREVRTPKDGMHSSASMDSKGSNKFFKRYRFGWLDKQEDYFLYQEEGFWHWGVGEMIEGMFALKEGFDTAYQAAEAAIDDYMRSKR